LQKIVKSKSRKPLFILTSGILVHGDSTKFVDETNEPQSKHLAGRIKIENFVVNHKDLRGVVLRPGFVYGGNGGFFANQAFSLKENDDLVIIGSKEKRWGWVHVDDLADAYVRVVKSGHVVDGEIFDVCDPWFPTYEEVLIAAAKATGWKGKVAHSPEVPKDNGWLQICEYTCIVNPKKAYNLLGWHENHLGIISEIDTYYTSWKNSK